jgi:hypothetical protein
MKDSDSEKDELLNSLLTDIESESAPEFDRVLRALRHEKHARSTRRALTGTIAATLLIALLFTWKPAKGTKTATTAPSVSMATNSAQSAKRKENVDPEIAKTAPLSNPQPVEKWKIKRIDDQQLLDMLENHSVALVKYPDGNRRLMLVDAGAGAE